MKPLKAHIDFFFQGNLQPQKEQLFLIKQSVASGWGRLAKVKRITKTQVVLEVVNVIPTIESNKFGEKNGMTDDRDKGNFFLDWAERKKALKEKEVKFFLKSGLEVGNSNSWNTNLLCTLI